jgi:hypothetical protein
VRAGLDDEASLVRAFEASFHAWSVNRNETVIKLNDFQGVQAIYAVTNFWEMIAIKSAHEAGKYEQQQRFNLAAAASKTPTRKHYVFSTLPGTMQYSNGKHFVPHMEYKTQVDDHIRKNLPELAKKTTFFWIEWYPTNMEYMPLIKPMEVVRHKKISITGSRMPKD